tara:strand:+ start:282 stop:1406 length:1125 start_codon:yes stop_codon:yes gene_type:complete
MSIASLREKARKARAARAAKPKAPKPNAPGGSKGKTSDLAAGMEAGKKKTFKSKKKFKAPSDMGSTPIGGFGEEIKNITNPQNILDKSREIFETKKVKDIRKKADEMFALIKANSTLTNFQKNNLREQIQFVKDNHARLGYSLNELMSAVGTNAFNQIVSRTPIDRDAAQKLGVTDKVQELMDKYGREAVLRGFDSEGNPIITARSPTAGELFADMGRGAAKMFGAGPITQFFTGGKGFDIKAPEFGFGDIPVSAASQYLGGAFPQFTTQDMTSFATPQSVGASKALQFAPMRDSRAGRTPETTTQQGDGSGDGGGGTTSSTFAYKPFALPVAYNYMGGPEQMYLGGGFTQDGTSIGPFRAADGGIANFKNYGY